MRFKIMNQKGFGLLSVLLTVTILGIIALVTIPAITGGGPGSDAGVVERADTDANTLNATLVESAAELAYLSESGYTKKEAYALGELVVMGYLNADLTPEQELELVIHTGNGSFTYEPAH